MVAVAATFACAQFLGVTTSSFSDSTANSGNTVTASADWTAPTISSVILQKAEGGVTNKFHPSDTFYVYAAVADTGNPAAGIGTITASTTNIATVSSATLTTTGGPWTVGGTSYNYRTAVLTAKSTLTTQSYSYSLSVSDSAGNGPATSSPTVASSTAAFAPSSFLTTNVTGTAGKADAGDTITFTYSSAPDPESVFAGWNGTSRTVNVAFADKGIYGTTSDIVGITDAGGNSTSIGFITTAGDYITGGNLVAYPTSTIALSGSTFTVTLGAPDVAASTRTDTASHAAVWSSFATAFDTFGNASSAATITGISRKQF
jgi:chitinase